MRMIKIVQNLYVTSFGYSTLIPKHVYTFIESQTLPFLILITYDSMIEAKFKCVWVISNELYCIDKILQIN